MRYKGGKINAIDDGYWMWFMSDGYEASFKNKEKYEPVEQITGKYLFFHEDPKVLSQVAIEEIMNNGFHLAKVNKKVLGANKDHVLCLYYQDDSRKNEMAEKYQNKNGIKYRYWKSDEDTHKGKYSKEFLDRINNRTVVNKNKKA